MKNWFQSLLLQMQVVRYATQRGVLREPGDHQRVRHAGHPEYPHELPARRGARRRAAQHEGLHPGVRRRPQGGVARVAGLALHSRMSDWLHGHIPAVIAWCFDCKITWHSRVSDWLHGHHAGCHHLNRVYSTPGCQIGYMDESIYTGCRRLNRVLTHNNNVSAKWYPTPACRG
jgi:hypothetical protein